MFFTGSDWCGWCIRLQNEVLKKPEFAAWAKENVVLLELDYPRRTPQLPEIQKQNMELQQMFEVRGYPTIWFSNPSKKDGQTNLEKLGSTGYVAGGPEKWLETANQILNKKLFIFPIYRIPFHKCYEKGFFLLYTLIAKEKNRI